MTKKPKIIALFGPQGSGKSTVSKLLSDEGNYVQISFADPIYAAMSAILGTDARSLGKNDQIPSMGGKTLRQCLQTLGANWGRDMISEDIWCNLAISFTKSAISRGFNVVIDDLRFVNEYEALMSSGLSVEFVKIQRDSVLDQQVDKHSSERDWKSFLFNTEIHNTGVDLQEFKQICREVFIES